MKYFPFALFLAFFSLLGLAIGGVLPFMLFLRIVGVSICMAICLLIAEAAVMKKAVKPPEEMRYVTAVAQTMLRKGDVCTVDTIHRTVERAAS